MKILLAIAGLLLCLESFNVFQVMSYSDQEELVLNYEQETEEEKKSEETGAKQFDKNHHPVDYYLHFMAIPRQVAYLHNTGLCLKGFCSLFSEPPEA